MVSLVLAVLALLAGLLVLVGTSVLGLTGVELAGVGVLLLAIALLVPAVDRRV